MKLKVLCDCDDNKVCTGNFDGEPMWHYRTAYIEGQQYIASEKQEMELMSFIPKSDWTDWMKDESYKQNSD